MTHSGLLLLYISEGTIVWFSLLQLTTHSSCTSGCALEKVKVHFITNHLVLWRFIFLKYGMGSLLPPMVTVFSPPTSGGQYWAHYSWLMRPRRHHATLTSDIKVRNIFYIFFSFRREKTARVKTNWLIWQMYVWLTITEAILPFNLYFILSLHWYY